MRHVVGLDLSMRASGVCDVHGDTYTARPDGTGDTRLAGIASLIADAVHRRDTPPDLVVLEDLPPAVRSGRTANVLGMVHGVARLTLLELAVPYVTVHLSHLKKYATGRGSCDKTAMALALAKRSRLGLERVERMDDNEVDAWWLRALGLDLLGEPILSLPETHRAVLAKVDLPEGLVS